MEHEKDAEAEFYASPAGSYWVVRRRGAHEHVAVIPTHLTDREQVVMANRIARGLCYDTAGLRRAHKAFRTGLIIGGLVAAVGALGTVIGMDLRRGDSCVELGPYTTVPTP